MADKGKEQDATVDGQTVQLVIKEAKELIRSLEGTATSRVTIKAGALQIEVERGGGAIVGGTMAPMTAGLPATGSASAAPASAPGVMPVVAPLIGVFYRAASPGAEPFVEVGDTVERGQVVGILEAMKVMNEVASDYRGVVAEILIENGTAVQYEQPLMLIDTAGGRSE
jgi:acetyl-CoA carboxylase biotin carboxyl carrier protein